MPDVSNDGQISALKKIWREALENDFTQAKDESGAKEIVAQINSPGMTDIIKTSWTGQKWIPPLTNGVAAVKAIEMNLTVSVAEVSAEKDKVTVEMKDDDTNEAAVIVGYIVKQKVSQAGSQNIIGRVVVDANNADKLDDEERTLRDKQQKLADKIMSGDSDASDAEKYREIDRQLDDLTKEEDLNITEAFIRLLDNPISVVEPTHVIGVGKKNDTIIMLAVFIAALAGAFLGFIVHLLIFKPAQKKSAVPPILKPPILAKAK